MPDKKSEVVISAKNVSKDFVLPHEKNTSVKSTIVNIFSSSKKDATTQHALRGVSFDIKRGEFFGILGRNGSGKSTMLKILAEIYQPTAGSVDIKGKLVPFIELGVGFNPELTGRENVYLNGALLGFSRAEIDARYDEIVEFAELEDFMDQKLKNYSSGMQVRLAFSVATRAEADILLVDEVLAVGDADFQRKCYDFFKALKKSGKTVIFVTHDMGAVREYCDRAILIDSGTVTYEGEAETVADEYLKLFNEDGHDKAGSRNTLQGRWGNHWLSIENLNVTHDDEIVKVVFDVLSDSPEDISFQAVYKFINDNDNIIAGTSLAPLTESKKAPVISSGARKNISVEFPNIFSAGTINISLTLQSPDGSTMYDVWPKAYEFVINSEKKYYPIYPPGEVEIKDSNAKE